MRYVVAGVLVAATILWVLGSVEQRQACNAEGDVRYLGDRKYQCQETFSGGLRWTWQF